MTTAPRPATDHNDAADETATGAKLEYLGLLEQFMQEALEEPDGTRLERIPNGDVLVIVPTDDPELAARELAMAERMRAEGRTVHVESIGPRRPAPPPPPPWWLGERIPQNMRAWLPAAESLLDAPKLTVIYDQDRDVLLVSQRHDQEGQAWPTKSGLYVLVDTGINTAFAFIVQNFVATAVPRLPHLGALLSLADVRPLTQADVGDFALPPARRPKAPLPDRPGSLSPADRGKLIKAFSELTGELKAS